MTNERNIVWEGERFWVLRLRGPKGKPITQIMKLGHVASESIETYAAGPDGESIAVVRAKYLDKRAIEKYESEMDVWRAEDPTKFLMRVAQYLSRQYPDGMKVIKALQR